MTVNERTGGPPSDEVEHPVEIRRDPTEPDKEETESFLRAVLIEKNPPWSKWLVRLLLTLTAFMAVTTMALATFFQSVAVRNLSEERVASDRVSNCYDLFTGKISSGTAGTLIGISALVNAVTSDPVDRELVAGVKAQLAAAEQGYQKALDDRSMWLAQGSPLPCPVLRN